MAAKLGSTVRGKCPACCPDGGAIFTVGADWAAYDRGETDRRIKKCINCGLSLPFRAVRPTGRKTYSQIRALARIGDAFGGEITKQKMIGRDLWVEMKNPARGMILGDSLFGTIGPGGKLKITLQRLFGDAVIQSDIDIKVYLGG